MLSAYSFCGRRRAGLLRAENPNPKDVRKLACAHLVIANTGLAHGVPTRFMLSPGRGRTRLAQARQTAQYLCHIRFSMTLTQIGQTFNRDRTSVSHACQRIEEMRDSPSHDLAMDCLEAGLEQLAQSLDLIDDDAC